MDYIRIKVCGITNLEDALLATHLGADALGFIFCESPRQISVENALEITRKLPPYVNKVAVVKDFSEGEIWSIVSQLPVDTIQFAGNETEEFCMGFFPLSIIKTIPIQSDESLEQIHHFQELNTFLLDTHSKQGGGSGKTFNWDIAIKAKQYGNIILAGGLNPDNIEEAVSMVQPYGVDVSSGLESEPGKKDPEKVRKFFSIIRRGR